MHTKFSYGGGARPGNPARGNVCRGVDLVWVLAVEGVAAARVGPHGGKGDFVCGALLQQQLVLRVEEEYGKCTVQQAMWSFWGEAVRVVLAGIADDGIVLVYEDALILEHKVLLGA